MKRYAIVSKKDDVSRHLAALIKDELKELIYDEEHPGKPKYDFNSIRRYQKDHEYQLDLIDFYDLQDAAEEYQENHESNNFNQ